MIMMKKKGQENVLNSYYGFPCCDSVLYYSRCLRLFVVTQDSEVGTRLYGVITRISSPTNTVISFMSVSVSNRQT
jgi:hypothetical protein